MDNSKRSEKIYGEIYGSFPVDDSTIENGNNFVKAGSDSIPSEKEGSQVGNPKKVTQGNLTDEKATDLKSKC